MNDETPNIGDTRISVYPSGAKYRQILVACVQCGKERWQEYRSKGSNRPLCSVCAGKKKMESPSFKEKILAGSRKRWDRPGEHERMSESMQGEKNHFYGKAHSPEALETMSKPRVNVNIGHNREWGYLVGLVLGDGWISQGKKSYKIGVSSTRAEIVDKYYDCCCKLGIHCSRYFPNGHHVAEVVSKKLYLYLRPYKYADFHFTIPEMVYKHKEMSRGFLRGFFDAEGGVYPSKDSQTGVSIECWSKHIDNLIQVKELLGMLGIESHLHPEKKKQISARLFISDYKNRVLFRDLVGFKIIRKHQRLLNMKPPIGQDYTIEQYNQAMDLRGRGFTCYEIQKLTGVNHNTVAGWYCFKSNGRLPRILRQQIIHTKNKKELNDIVT